MTPSLFVVVQVYVVLFLLRFSLFDHYCCISVYIKAQSYHRLRRRAWCAGRFSRPSDSILKLLVDVMIIIISVITINITTILFIIIIITIIIIIIHIRIVAFLGRPQALMIEDRPRHSDRPLLVRTLQHCFKCNWIIRFVCLFISVVVCFIMIIIVIIIIIESVCCLMIRTLRLSHTRVWLTERMILPPI